jgi:hypothetical protein
MVGWPVTGKLGTRMTRRVSHGTIEKVGAIVKQSSGQDEARLHRQARDGDQRHAYSISRGSPAPDR